MGGTPHPENCALVLGVNGQDGSYLCEHLLSEGWKVVGVGRQTRSRWVSLTENYIYQSLDIADVGRWEELLGNIRPNAIFHFAAVHGSAGFSYEDNWKEVHAVNTASLHGALEYLRREHPTGTLVYASSSKVFGDELPIHVTESSPRYSRCIYTVTKNAASDLIDYYRRRHNLAASVVWTFNHESPRRKQSYFIPRIIDSLARSISDPDYVTEIGTLRFWCDWGDAREFMRVIARISEKTPGEDYILATGKTWWAEDLVNILFSSHGLDWKRHLVETLPAPCNRPPLWHADTGKLTRAIDVALTRTILQVADDMLQLLYPETPRTPRQ